MALQRSGALWAPSEIDAQRLTDQLRASRLTVLCGGPAAPTPRVLEAGVLPRVQRRAEDRGKGERQASAKALASADRRQGASGAGAEVSVFFDRWSGSARQALNHCLQESLRGHAVPKGGKLPLRLDDRLIALSGRYRVRFLLVFDRFEDCLLAPTDNKDLRALREEIYSVVNRAQVPAHVLLTLREDGEPLLDRLRGRIRGFEPLRKPFPLDGAQGIGPWTLSWLAPVTAVALSRPPRTQAVYASIEALLGEVAQREAAQEAEPRSAEDEAWALPVAEVPADGVDPTLPVIGLDNLSAYGLAQNDPAPDAVAPLLGDEAWAALGSPVEASDPAVAPASVREPDAGPPAAADGAPGAPASEPLPGRPAVAGAAPNPPNPPNPKTVDPPAAADGAPFSEASLERFMSELDDVLAQSTAAPADAPTQAVPAPDLADLARWVATEWPEDAQPPRPAAGVEGASATAEPAPLPGPMPAAEAEPPAQTEPALPAAARPAAPLTEPPAGLSATLQARPEPPPLPESLPEPEPDEAVASLSSGAEAASQPEPAGLALEPVADASPHEPLPAPSVGAPEGHGEAAAEHDVPPTADAIDSAANTAVVEIPPMPSIERAVAVVPRAPAAFPPKEARRTWGDRLRRRGSLRAQQRAKAGLADEDGAGQARSWWRRHPAAGAIGTLMGAVLLGLGLWATWGPERSPSAGTAGGSGGALSSISIDADPPAAGMPPIVPGRLVELSAAGPLAQSLADELARALPPGTGPTLLARGTAGWADDLGALGHPGRLAIVRQDALAAAHTNASLGPLQVVLPLFTEELVFVVRADSPLRYIHQIEGRRLNLGAAESARALSVRTAYEQLFGRSLPADKADAADEPDGLLQLLEGRVDVVALVGGAPGSWPVAAALTDATQFRLLRLDRNHPASRRALRSMLPGQLATGVDGLPAAQPTPTLAVRSYLVAGVAAGSDPDGNDLGGLARAVCQQLPTLQREGHAKWREVRIGALPEAGWPYAPEAAFALKDCASRMPAPKRSDRIALPEPEPEAGGSAQP